MWTVLSSWFWPGFATVMVSFHFLLALLIVLFLTLSTGETSQKVLKPHPRTTKSRKEVLSVLRAMNMTIPDPLDFYFNWWV